MLTRALLILTIFGTVLAGKPSLRAFLSHVQRLCEDIERKGSPEIEINYDSLSNANNMLANYLNRNLPLLPITLDSTLTFGWHLGSTVSTDHRLRIWNWDNLTGGSMPNETNLAQFRTSRGIGIRYLLASAENTGGIVDSIFQIKTSAGQTVYLVRVMSKFSNKDCGQSIQAYSIFGNHLIQMPAIFDTKKKKLESISFQYNYFTNYDSDLGTEIHKINLDPHGLLRIPVVVEDSVTGRNLEYQFDGARFVFQCTK